MHSERCDVCGTVRELEQRYDVRDRFIRALFVAVCQSMNLVPYRHGKKTSVALWVTADAATHERLAARLGVLLPAFDDKLFAVTADFLREHCGVELPIRPRT